MVGEYKISSEDLQLRHCLNTTSITQTTDALKAYITPIRDQFDAMAPYQIRHNSYNFTQREAELACALGIHLGKDDETIGLILGAKRSGIGGPPLPCAGLVSSLGRSGHPVYGRVRNNGAQWQPEANRLYQWWMGAMSQEVRRYGANNSS